MKTPGLVLLVLAMSTAVAVAGSVGPAERLRTLWDAANGYLGAPAETGLPAGTWAGNMVERFVDTRFLAEALLEETDPSAERETRTLLADALSVWMVRRLSGWLRRHGEALRTRMADGAAELIIQNANTRGGLATGAVQIRLGRRSWDALVQLHRDDGVWRLYDVESAGLTLQGVLRALWLDVRSGRSSAREAIQALARSERSAEPAD